MLLSFFLLLAGASYGFENQTITLFFSSGESASFEIQKSDSFVEVLDKIQSYFLLDPAFSETNEAVFEEDLKELIPLNTQLNLVISHAGLSIRAKKEWRNYDLPVKKNEKDDISYIITTLAQETLWNIGKSHRSSLKNAGERIDHLHPLRFLMTAFTSERLKSGVHAIRDRGGWIWSGFLDGLTGSLNEEAKNDNLYQYVSDFARKVSINVDLILPSLKAKKWEEFINVLIDKIPREIDPNRYDM